MPLGCHTFAALCTFSAGVDAGLHVAKTFAVFRALTADFCALAAYVLVVLGTD